MAQEQFEHLKNKEITMKMGKCVEDTKILDGEAEGNGFLDGTNETVQYKTPALKKNDLGGENNMNG